MKLNELKNRMPDAIRDIDYFNHIVIAQNDEIIRLLKKLTGEVDAEMVNIKEIEVASLSVELPVQEEPVKTKRKKKEV